MKLLSVTYKNVRLLRDVRIDFSTDDEKKLTVIRAENGTGKTTAMTGLIWGLYGSKYITEKLYPLSLVEDGQTKIDIEVQIDFETEEAVSRQGKTLVNRKLYRLIRKCTETVSDDGKSFSRTNDIVSLFENGDNGFVPKVQSEIDSIVERALPAHLKDIYFTDGDKALTFIESTVSGSEKRLRVQKAIESLLSMKDLEALIGNLASVKRNFLSQIDKSDYSQKLLDTEQEIHENEEWIGGSEQELKELLASQTDLGDKLKKIRNSIEEQLKLGNKEALSQEVKAIQKQIGSAENIQNNAIKSLCSLLNSPKISTSLIQEKLEPARKILEKMKARDNFPKQFIPVLNDILQRGKCLCGENLNDNSARAKDKLIYINDVIQESKEADLLNSRASNLYFAADQYSSTEKTWSSSYDTTTKNYFNAGSSLAALKLNLKKKNEMIDEINDELLISLRDQEKILSSKQNELRNEITITGDEIVRLKEKNKELKVEADKYSSKLNKKNTAGGKHRLAEALKKLFDSVFNEIKTTELKKVSTEMNRIFLLMIGADSGIDPKGMIRRAELSQDFDIKVYGPSEQPLNPDTELNGASRRAISLSFILALTKVSSVEATNIIDTPLGMTSGLVKSSILENLIAEGSQIVMFLTFDEIKGVETILDKFAGSSVTLSFSGHFPKMLKNKPLEDGVTQICKCNHRQFCSICERTDQLNLVSRVS